MSQSPVDDFSEEEVLRYRQGWSLLVRLLHLDRSFSGRERHCAFLNLDGRRFADISAVSGFDFPGDGRAVVASDWDFDGDLDLWVTARTAPRLRLLRNDLAAGGRSVALRLHGDGKRSNRDAVGARCELWVKGDPRPLIRGVRAGDAFLSQSGTWLHFGLGDGAEVDRLEVHWPGGSKEQFSGVEAGGFFDVRQGTGLVERWSPPNNRKALSATEQEIEAESETARTVLPNRLPLPPMMAADGTEIPVSTLSGPLLINLWASWCAPCVAELREWTEQADRFRGAGLRVLSLNTDALGDGADSSGARALVEKIGFPFETAEASARTVQLLDLYQRAFFDRWLPLPVPASFLVDRHGRVAVIYKGPVRASTVVADMDLLDASPEELRRAATPFRGRWGSPPPVTGPGDFTTQLIDHSLIQVAESYLRYYVDFEKTLSGARPALGDLLERAGSLASARGDHGAAAKAYREALVYRPGDGTLSTSLEEAERKAAGSLEALRKAVAENPGNGAAHLRLADALRNSGDFAGAIAGYKETLRRSPKTLVAAGRLSWTLAAHPDEAIRNPAEALALAERLHALTKGEDPHYLDLLGVAQAAAGDFEAAAASARAALSLFEAKTPIYRAVSARLDLYEEGKPFFEEGWRGK